MTQTGQNSAVRTRDEQTQWMARCIRASADHPSLEGFLCEHIRIAEARGAEEQRRKDAEALLDPKAVHLNMLCGTIARPSWEQIKHLYAADVITLQARATVLEAALTRIADSDPFCGSQTLRHTARAALTREGGV